MGSPELLVSGLPLDHPDVGVGVYTRRLVEALVRRAPAGGVAVVLPEEWPRGGVPSGMAVLTVPGRSPVRHPMLRKMWWERRVLNFVAASSASSLFHSPGPISGGRCPPRCAVTLHDCLYRRFPRYLGRWGVRGWRMRATERFAAGASLVLTVSHAAFADLADMAGVSPERMRVLYPWVGGEFDPESAKAAAPSVRERLNLPGRFWLYLGGYDYRKDVETLLQAYASLPPGEAPPLVLAGRVPEPGRGPVTDVAGRLGALGLGVDRVLLPGHVAAEDLPGLYAAAELLIYPSLGEGFGFPAAEALAVGTPALVADSTSLPEVVRDPAWRFVPGDAADLAARLRRCVSGDLPACPSLPDEFREVVAIERYLSLLADV